MNQNNYAEITRYISEGIESGLFITEDSRNISQFLREINRLQQQILTNQMLFGQTMIMVPDNGEFPQIVEQGTIINYSGTQPEVLDPCESDSEFLRRILKFGPSKVKRKKFHK